MSSSSSAWTRSKAGQTSEKTARSFRSRGAQQIFVSNRSFERAEALAAITGGRAIHFEDWERGFHDLDVLVSSTAAPHVILTPEKLAPLLRTRRHRPLFIIDLAIPRDINPAVHTLDGVYLYDLDALRSMAERTLEARRQEAENCHRLIEQHVLDFQLWIERIQPPGYSPVASTPPDSGMSGATDRSRAVRVLRPVKTFASPGATEQLWNALHNCSVAPKTPDVYRCA